MGSAMLGKTKPWTGGSVDGWEVGEVRSVESEVIVLNTKALH